MSLRPSKYPVTHAGIATTGHIVLTRGPGTGGISAVDQPSEVELTRRSVRAIEANGPWVRLPGNPPDHKIVGELPDGWKVSALAAGLVYNDAELVDSICGAGTYERVMPPLEVEILKLARLLYPSAEVAN